MTTSTGQLLKIKQRHPEFGTIFLNAADEELGKQLPPLGLPYMSEEARAAFRALLQYEKPPANGSLLDVLQVVEARGFCAHPCDWIPEYSWQFGGSHPAMYQPWVDWLSEQGLTKFHRGNTLTTKNCKRWSRGQRRWALKKMIRDGRDDDFGALKDFASTQPTSIRMQLVDEVYAWGSFDGCYPWQTPLLAYLQNDRAEKVSGVASYKLDKMGVFANEEAYAQKLAAELTVTADCVRYRDPPEDYIMSFHFYKEFVCVSFNSLAAALGLAPTELAQRADLDDAGKQIMQVAAMTGDVEIRSIFATRMLEQGKGGEHMSVALFKGVAKPLWERGLKAMFASAYSNSVQDYLGNKTGTLNSAMMREWNCSHYIAQTVTAELERGELPVNTIYDDLRVLGKVVDKQAAAEVLDEALAAGMRPDNPRLTMLKLNLAL
jgi:hypothetical protein